MGSQVARTTAVVQHDPSGGGPAGGLPRGGNQTGMVVDEVVGSRKIPTTTGIGILAADPVLGGLLAERFDGDGYSARTLPLGVDASSESQADVLLAMPPADAATALGVGWPRILGALPIDRSLVVIASPSVPLRRAVLDRPATAGLVVLDSTNVSTYRQIRNAIGLAASGDRVIDAPFRDPGVFVSDGELLTSTERSVLRFVGEGLSNLGISGEMFISERTVEGHIRSIFSKLSLVDRPEVNRRVMAALAARATFGGSR